MVKLITFLFIVLVNIGLIIETKSKNTEKITLEYSQPKELGKVNWLRDMQEATNQSTKTGKPIFLLFQEVPGCATCQNYGETVLSHPLIVEAIETYFVPLAIFNNKGGKDRAVLNYFNEPTWNNPVVRIIDNNKKNLIDRISGNYSSLAVTQSMIEVLKAQKTKVPEFLNLLHQELSATEKGLDRTYVSMYCFWTGEKKLADIEGIISTQAGFMDGREVVEINYAPELISYGDLIERAKAKSCASHVYTENLSQQLEAEKIVESVSNKKEFRIDRETKYYLYKSSYKYLPMTKLQAVKANSLIGKGQSPNSIFSPRQLSLLNYIQKHTHKKWASAINKNIIEAWDQALAIQD